MTRLALEYIRGHIDNGVMPTLKHFPGHGSVLSDTHTTVSKCDYEYNDLIAHIEPFKQIYKMYQIPIMTSHIIYNKISDDPVTTSSTWLLGHSKKIYGQKPIFISDDLEMSAISEKYNNNSKIEILNKVFSAGCNFAIITTMQSKGIIESNSSYQYYKSQYLDKLEDIEIRSTDNIDLLCSKHIIYNKGDNKIYQRSLECIDNLFEEKMNAIYDTTYTSLISISIIALLLLFIKNKLISVILAVSEKTSTIYDELLLHSIKSPSSYLIVIGYLLIVMEYFVNEGLLNFNFALSTSLFLLIVLMISWSIIRGLNFYLTSKPYIRNLTSDDDATLVSETYEIVVRIIKIIVAVITLLIIMQELGLSISGLLAFGGVGGLIVGLAAKDLLSNFFGGMMIFFDRPFRVGEFIKSPDRNIEGIVEKIGWRLTVVRTFSKNVLYIPNTAFSSIIVENATRMSNRRINETIGIRYDDLSKMKSIISDVNLILSDNVNIDQSQKAKVYFKTFSASSCDFFIYAFTLTKDWEEFLSIKQDILLEVAEIIEKHDAEIAYPTTTVFINKD